MLIMPGLKNTNNNTTRTWKKVKNDVLTRKIRLICNDPDATDLSSDDELKPASHKRSISEIHIPLISSAGRMIRRKPKSKFKSKSKSKRTSKMPNKKNRAVCNSVSKEL